MHRFATLALLAAFGAVAACNATAPSADPRSGGATTVFDVTSGAYGNAAANLTGPRLDQFDLGHSIFEQNWVTAPATTSDMDGLGPTFNQRSCSSCHAHDGRSAPFDRSGALLGVLFRLSVPGVDAHGGPLGDPVYGTQLRPVGILGVPGDGTPHMTYVERVGHYGDGSSYSLHTPSSTVAPWNFGAPSAQLMMSPRTGPIVVGLGLLEAVSESDILSHVRPSADADGVIGQANYVYDVASGMTKLGRFGWKANQPSVLQQTAGALNGDIGITSTLLPDENCTASMGTCLGATRGPQPDISRPLLTALTVYMETLAVPARRSVADPTVLYGEQLFSDFGCASCHLPTLHTGTLDGFAEVSNQTIHPFTDLLLHDMGADLADGRPDYLASGRQWRTPPLWGIGLQLEVNGHTQLLHDGRARGLSEAILWHGGEAMTAAERFRQAAADERADLILFLESL